MGNTQGLLAGFEAELLHIWLAQVTLTQLLASCFPSLFQKKLTQCFSTP
jgi:hypothetical protein